MSTRVPPIFYRLSFFLPTGPRPKFLTFYGAHNFASRSARTRAPHDIVVSARTLVVPLDVIYFYDLKNDRTRENPVPAR